MVKRLVSITELRIFKQIILNNQMLVMCLSPPRVCAIRCQRCVFFLYVCVRCQRVFRKLFYISQKSQKRDQTKFINLSKVQYLDLFTTYHL